MWDSEHSSRRSGRPRGTSASLLESGTDAAGYSTGRRLLFWALSFVPAVLLVAVLLLNGGWTWSPALRHTGGDVAETLVAGIRWGSDGAPPPGTASVIRLPVGSTVVGFSALCTHDGDRSGIATFPQIVRNASLASAHEDIAMIVEVHRERVVEEMREGTATWTRRTEPGYVSVLPFVPGGLDSLPHSCTFSVSFFTPANHGLPWGG